MSKCQQTFKSTGAYSTSCRSAAIGGRTHTTLLGSGKPLSFSRLATFEVESIEASPLRVERRTEQLKITSQGHYCSGQQATRIICELHTHTLYHTHSQRRVIEISLLWLEIRRSNPNQPTLLFDWIISRYNRTRIQRNICAWSTLCMTNSKYIYQTTHSPIWSQ